MVRVRKNDKPHTLFSHLANRNSLYILQVSEHVIPLMCHGTTVTTLTVKHRQKGVSVCVFTEFWENYEHWLVMAIPHNKYIHCACSHDCHMTD